VAAATIVPLFWQKGTVIATAMTPVIVALVSEGLRKPAEKITAVAPRVTRRTATGAAMRRFDPAAADTRHPESVGARGRGPERYDPDMPRGGVSAEDPFGLHEAATPRRAWWKIGLATGLLAFVIGAGVVTASELALFGNSVSGAGHGKTSLFGGSTKQSTADATPTPTPDATATPDATPTVTSTSTPTATATQTPTTTAAPDSQAAPTPTPAATP
jgi:cell division septation protein DedD